MVASDAVRTRVAGRTLTLSNLDKVLYPATGYTKAEVINYYPQIAPVMLPYIADRALTRLRFPDGVGERLLLLREERTDGYSALGTPGGSAPATEHRLRGRRRAADRGLAGQPGRPGTARPAVDRRQRPARGTGWSTSRSPSRGRGEPLANRVVVDLDPGAGMTIVESAPGGADRGRADGQRRAGPGAPDLGQQGNPGVRRRRAGRSRDVWSYVKQLNATLAKA